MSEELAEEKISELEKTGLTPGELLALTIVSVCFHCGAVGGILFCLVQWVRGKL